MQMRYIAEDANINKFLRLGFNLQEQKPHFQGNAMVLADKIRQTAKT